MGNAPEPSSPSHPCGWPCGSFVNINHNLWTNNSAVTTRCRETVHRISMTSRRNGILVVLAHLCAPSLLIGPPPSFGRTRTATTPGCSHQVAHDHEERRDHSNDQIDLVLGQRTHPPRGSQRRAAGQLNRPGGRADRGQTESHHQQRVVRPSSGQVTVRQCASSPRRPTQRALDAGERKQWAEQANAEEQVRTSDAGSHHCECCQSAKCHSRRERSLSVRRHGHSPIIHRFRWQPCGDSSACA